MLSQHPSLRNGIYFVSMKVRKSGRMDNAHYFFRKKTSWIQATKYHRWKKRKDGTGWDWKKYNLLLSPYLRSLFDKGGNKEQAGLKAGNLAGAVSSNPRRCGFNILVNYSINSEFFFNCCHTKTLAMNPQHISCRLYDRSWNFEATYWAQTLMVSDSKLPAQGKRTISD